MARDDPLATRVWKMYARTKAALPHAQRMENLTWRMMTMALKKMPGKDGKEGESQLTPALGTKDLRADFAKPSLAGSAHFPTKREQSPSGPAGAGDDQVRGRRPDKAAARVRVVGFEGKNQDGDDEEYVTICYIN
jgi:GATA-binding protein